MVLIDIKRTFPGNSEKICLPTMEVLFCAAVSDLAKSKKLQDWISRNAVLFSPLLTEAVITNGEIASEALLKPFMEKIKNMGHRTYQKRRTRIKTAGLTKTMKTKKLIRGQQNM